MKQLEERILADATVKPDGVLKVDAFLNHQMDIHLFQQMAQEWQVAFAGKPINKVLTIEASGIGLATVVGMVFDVPVVFAKKNKSTDLDGTVYFTEVTSNPGNIKSKVIISKKYITAADHILLIDDFLANGTAMTGLTSICEHAGATVEGIGIAIEKCWEPGGDLLREQGYQVEALARIAEMNAETGEIEFA